MGKKLYFMNNNAFDIRAMTTFGVSVKKKEDPIGFFGTGFKYAIAIILRLHGQISIETNSTTYRFTARREKIRGEEFDLVYINDKEAGFTTHVGINWQPWQAFRELYCNCLDENGKVDLAPEAFDTVITVDCDLIYQAFCDKHLYFCEGKPAFSNSEVEVFERPSANFFFRGIAVRGMPYPAKFSYSILGPVELTEDRTAKYEHSVLYPIQRFVQNYASEEFCRKFLTAEKDSFENQMLFESSWGCSDAFYNTVQNLIASDIGVRETARMTVKKRDERAGIWPEFYLTAVQFSMLQKAKEFLKGLGVDISMFDIKTVQGLGETCMGRAHEGTIYISELPFNMGTKQLAGTLLEEWVHIKHGCRDFDRVMQNWLFDKVISLGEEIKGEPI